MGKKIGSLYNDKSSAVPENSTIPEECAPIKIAWNHKKQEVPDIRDPKNLTLYYQISKHIPQLLVDYMNFKN